MALRVLRVRSPGAFFGCVLRVRSPSAFSECVLRVRLDPAVAAGCHEICRWHTSHGTYARSTGLGTAWSSPAIHNRNCTRMEIPHPRSDRRGGPRSTSAHHRRSPVWSGGLARFPELRGHDRRGLPRAGGLHLPASRGRTGAHALVDGPDETHARERGPSCGRGRGLRLLVRLHPSVRGRQRPHPSLPHAQHPGEARLYPARRHLPSLGRHTARPAKLLPGLWRRGHKSRNSGACAKRAASSSHCCCRFISHQTVGWLLFRIARIPTARRSGSCSRLYVSSNAR